MVSYRVCQRIDGPRRFRRLGVGMNAYLAEIAPEARLEESACGFRQWLAAAAQFLDLRLHCRSNLWSLSGNLFGLEWELLRFFHFFIHRLPLNLFFFTLRTL